MPASPWSGVHARRVTRARRWSVAPQCTRFTPEVQRHDAGCSPRSFSVALHLQCSLILSFSPSPSPPCPVTFFSQMFLLLRARGRSQGRESLTTHILETYLSLARKAPASCHTPVTLEKTNFPMSFHKRRRRRRDGGIPCSFARDYDRLRECERVNI